jgi:hypothetical protein
MRIDDKLLQQANAQRPNCSYWILTYKMQSCRQSMGKDTQAFGKLQQAKAVLEMVTKIYEAGSNKSSAAAKCVYVYSSNHCFCPCNRELYWKEGSVGD